VVGEHRAGQVLAAQSPAVKHVVVAELHIVVATVLAVAADAVLVAHHLPKLSAHLVTALARLHVRILAQKSSSKAGSTREKKGGEKRGNARNFVRQFDTGGMKHRWRARVYPERENRVTAAHTNGQRDVSRCEAHSLL
jgi:hypothetical protein